MCSTPFHREALGLDVVAADEAGFAASFQSADGALIRRRNSRSVLPLHVPPSASYDTYRQVPSCCIHVTGRPGSSVDDAKGSLLCRPPMAPPSSRSFEQPSQPALWMLPTWPPWRCTARAHPWGTPSRRARPLLCSTRPAGVAASPWSCRWVHAQGVVAAWAPAWMYCWGRLALRRIHPFSKSCSVCCLLLRAAWQPSAGPVSVHMCIGVHACMSLTATVELSGRGRMGAPLTARNGGFMPAQ